MLPKIIFSLETWKFNKEFGVWVSSLGHFKDRRKRNLSYRINQSGYCAVQTESGKKLAHRLVLLTFRPIPNAEDLTVDHLNHNKRDNSLNNLEWVTRETNLERAKRDKLTKIEEYELDYQEASFSTNGEEKKCVINENTLVYFNGVLMPLKYTIKIIKGIASTTQSKKEVTEKIITALGNKPSRRLYGFDFKVKED